MKNNTLFVCTLIEEGVAASAAGTRRTHLALPEPRTPPSQVPCRSWNTRPPTTHTAQRPVGCRRPGPAPAPAPPPPGLTGWSSGSCPAARWPLALAARALARPGWRRAGPRRAGGRLRAASDCRGRLFSHRCRARPVRSRSAARDGGDGEDAPAGGRRRRGCVRGGDAG